MTQPSDPAEYIWPCGHHQGVQVKPAPTAAVLEPVEFPLPLAKPVRYFDAYEKDGIPALRRCCGCGHKYRLFRIPEECNLCGHSFRRPCSTCTILSVTGRREIATADFRVTGEFDQTPAYWRCRLCEDIHPFGTSTDDQIITDGFLDAKKGKGLRCSTCCEKFHESNWVISPFYIYLGTWDGKIVAESGPWHWSLAWHRDVAGNRRVVSHGAEGECCRRNSHGRRRRAIPWIGSSESGMETTNTTRSIQKKVSMSLNSQRTRLPTLPTPPQSRSPSPTNEKVTRNESYPSSKESQQLPTTAEIYPLPLFSLNLLTQSTRKQTSNPPAPKSPPPPIPSGVDWKSRPLPPLPLVPRSPDASTQDVKGRPQSRMGYYHSDMVGDSVHNGTHRLQPIRNSLQTHLRSRSGEIPGGNLTSSDDNNNNNTTTRRIYHSKSHQNFQQPPTNPVQQTYTIPKRLPSCFLVMPTPEPSPVVVPEIAIQPESPVERGEGLHRSDSVVTYSSSCYSNDEIAIGPQNHKEEDEGEEIYVGSFMLPRSPDEAAGIMMTPAALDEAPNPKSSQNTRASPSRVSTPSMPGLNVGPDRHRSNSNITFQAPPPTTPRSSRASPPRYSLFPQITANPTPAVTTAATATTTRVLRQSSSSTALQTPPPRTLRPSASSVALRPPPENGYGHLRSRSEGLDASAAATGVPRGTGMSPSTTIGFDGMGRQVQVQVQQTQQSKYHMNYPLATTTTGSSHGIPPPPRSPGYTGMVRHPEIRGAAIARPVGPSASTIEIIDLYHQPQVERGQEFYPEGQGQATVNNPSEQRKMSNPRLQQRSQAREHDWRGFGDDLHGRDEHAHSYSREGSWDGPGTAGAGTNRGHSRRQTLVKAFKPKNWF